MSLGVLLLRRNSEPLTLGEDLESVFENAWGCLKAGCESELGLRVSIILTKQGRVCDQEGSILQQSDERTEPPLGEGQHVP